MKSTVLVLLALFAAPSIATPDRVSTCDPRLVLVDGRGVEGETFPGQRVELVIPCVSKADLAKVLADLGRMNGGEIEAVRDAKDVHVVLSTGLLTRKTSGAIIGRSR